MYTALRRYRKVIWYQVYLPRSLCRHDIDGSSVKKVDKFPSPFRVTLEVEWERESDTGHRAASWQNLPYPKATPLTCFSSRNEEQEVLKLLGDPLINTCVRKLDWSLHVFENVCVTVLNIASNIYSESTTVTIKKTVQCMGPVFVMFVQC